ncbi:MAG: methyltransferase domain-containing protein [Magnetococcales bacterium]|nr:methyltransferase domain-containing protein [Magnetococcales bacterium]
MSNDTTGKESRQVAFWRGAFGTTYTQRNAPDDWQLRSRVRMWSEILRSTVGAPPTSILEVGANLGINLRVLGSLVDAKLHALEPNAAARARLEEDGVLPADAIHDGFASAIPLADGAVDLAFTSGVLIHIHPDDLEASCREIHRVASRYIVCVEYFSDKPESIPYRGHDDVLFKRDFGGFWLDLFPDLQVLDYGFAWKRMTGLDNLTWWIFAKP